MYWSNLMSITDLSVLRKLFVPTRSEIEPEIFPLFVFTLISPEQFVRVTGARVEVTSIEFVQFSSFTLPF